MKKYSLKLAFLLIATLVCSLAFAKEPVTFQVDAPMQVAAGEAFRVGFVLNAKPENSDSFKAPSFTGFDVLAGPSIATSSSTQIINGKMTRSANYTFTYVVTAPEAGTFTIAPASIEVDSKRYSTKPLPIEVVSEQQAATQSGGGGTASSSQSTSTQSQGIAKDDVFMRTVVSRKSLFKGEPLRVSVKLYSRINIVGAENEKKPSFNGFWSQDIKDSARQSAQRETYNGKVYETQTLYDYLLYPQQSGKLTIDAASLTVIAQIRIKSNNVDPFFGGGFEIINARRDIATQPIEIDVKPLPSGAPSSFSGAVGNFSMESELDPISVAANSSLSYVVRISGTGNLSLVQAPEITLPTSFEQYNVKTTESINTSANGASGYKQFEDPLIPRAEGDFTVQPARFTFFNPTTMQYQTLDSKRYDIAVAPDGDGSSSSATVQRVQSKVDIEMLGEDIRFIKIDKSGLREQAQPLLFSRTYYVILAAIFVLFAALYLALRKYIRESQNATLTRGKRANKVAIQRFKLANSFISAQNEKGFYREVLSAIWGYMSDKFNIPVANLTKESVRDELAKRGVDSSLIQRFSDITTLCEEAQYSPMASAQMNEVYNKALKLISQIETEIKGGSNNPLKR